MKESLWGYWIIVLGIFILVVMMLLQNFTTTNEQDYYLVKEVTEASMVDAIDFTHYRKYGELRIIKEKFVESFIRRFSDTVNINKKYDIKFYDIYEAPPKVSVKVTTTTDKFHIFSDETSANVTNKLDAILETTKASDTTPEETDEEDTDEEDDDTATKLETVKVKTTYNLVFKDKQDKEISSTSCDIQPGEATCTITDFPQALSDGTKILGWAVSKDAKNYSFANDSTAKYVLSTSTKNQKLYAITEVTEKAKLTDGVLTGSTLWPIFSQTLKCDGGATITIPAGTSVLASTKNKDRNIGLGAKYIFVDVNGKTNCSALTENYFINLPDYIPSAKFNITNSYSSIYRSAGHDLPGITGTNLYANYNIKYGYNAKLGRSEYVAPVYTKFAIMLKEAEDKAQNQKPKHSLLIYDAYRPRKVSEYVGLKYHEILYDKSNPYHKEMYNAVNAINNPKASYWAGEGWYIASGRSNHNLGLAVDVTLADENGNELTAPTAMHELSSLAAKTSTNMQNAVASELNSIFSFVGANPLGSEWWHYELASFQGVIDKKCGTGVYYGYSNGKYKQTNPYGCNFRVGDIVSK